MEGNAFVQCRSFDAKMVNGDKLDINAEKVNIEAIYGEDTWITASDDITVGLMRGSIEVKSLKQSNIWKHVANIYKNPYKSVSE